MNISRLLERPISFQKIFVDMGVGITGALMLSQALYWNNRTSNPEGWFYKTQKQWEDETGMTRSEQETARKRLIQLGVIEEKLSGVPAKLHYRVNMINLEENLQTVMQKTKKLVCRKHANCDEGNLQTITETTTETTTEITNNKNKSRKTLMDDSVNEIFEYWRDSMQKQSAKKTPARIQKIKSRLSDGYTVSDIKRAIDGCRKSDFHMGKNDAGKQYNCLTHICRSAEKLEQFMEYATACKPQQQREDLPRPSKTMIAWDKT